VLALLHALAADGIPAAEMTATIARHRCAGLSVPRACA
jgi:hypothetical protein